MSKYEELDRLDMHDFCDDHPEFLSPLRNGIDILRKKTLGVNRWKAIARARSDIMRRKYMDVFEILVRMLTNLRRFKFSLLSSIHVPLTVPSQSQSSEISV